VDGTETFVTVVDDRPTGFVKDIEDMSRLQDRGRQDIGGAVYDRGYGRRWAEGE